MSADPEKMKTFDLASPVTLSMSRMDFVRETSLATLIIKGTVMHSVVAVVRMPWAQ